MRRTIVAVGASLLAVVSVPHAGAHEPTLAGQVCQLESAVSDPGDDTSYTVVVDGGPLAAAKIATVQPDLGEVALDNPVTITMTCTVRSGWYFTHSDPAEASVSATAPAVVTVPPTALTAHDDENFGLFAVCTSVSMTDRDGDTTDLYWNPHTVEFSTDPNTPCGPVFCPLDAGDPCGGGNPFELLNDLFVDVVDPLLCAVLDDYFPPDGDVEGVWDCPPYQF